MKLDIKKDLLQTKIPTNKWLVKDSNVKIIRKTSADVELPLNKENELILKKLIDFVRYSQDSDLNVSTNSDYLRPAVGLAAPQIGSNTNMFFVRFEYKKEDNDAEEFAMINPKITAKSEQITCLSDGEGCLSVDKDYQGLVPRSYKIQLEGYEWIRKENVKFTLRGYQAIVFQHEIEHNQGKLYYDKINQQDTYFKEDDWIII